MQPHNRDLFETIFKTLADKRGAFTLQDKLALVNELLIQAETTGSVPLSENQMAKVNVNDPRVKALIAGEQVALSAAAFRGAAAMGTTTLGGEASIQQKLTGLGNRQKVLLLAGVLVGILAFMGGLMALASKRGGNPEFMAIVLTATTTATPLPFTPTASPTALSQLPESSFHLVAPDEDKPSAKPNDPVSVEFGGLAFVLAQGKVTAENTWQPSGGGEWLRGTELRRVVAVPYSQEVGLAVQGLSFGAEIKLRLNSGEVVTYRLSEMLRLKRHQIESLSALSPSLVVVLYGERSGERYVLVADAVQGCPEEGICRIPTPFADLPSPSATAQPTASPTPQLSFAPPLQSSLVITESWTVTNTLAGLRLEVLACTRLTQIGDQDGRFVVCEVRLSALQAGATYSGQALAIAEYSQVETSLDWWPPAVSLAGALGDGLLGQPGDQVSGKVAGEVKKGGLGSASNPVLLWEQSGLRFVIYLE